MTRRGFILAMAASAALGAGTATAADPVVSGVVSAQRTDGSGIVDVAYDLADADGNACYISLQASDDGGATWDVPCQSLGGDAGAGVASGTGRVLTWNVGLDHPGTARNDLLVRVLASDLGVSHPAHAPHNYVSLMTGNPTFYASTLESIARADFLHVTATWVWDNGDNEAAGIVGRVKAVNPDCRVLGYASAKTLRLDWANMPAGSYGRTLWDALLPYWCYTTTGDTLQDWPGVVNVDILNPACRDIIVDTFADFQESSSSAFDGIFWDYFNNGIWIPDFVDVSGYPDLDGDGIGMPSDPDELAAYRSACEQLVLSLRARLGEGFLQIFNGQRCYTDSTFATLADGVNYELFPTLGFAAPDKMNKALDPAVYNSLWNARRWPRTVNGGPYLFLENKNRYLYYDAEGDLTELLPGNMFRAISLLIDGCCPVWLDNPEQELAWPPVPITLGEPLGPPTIAGAVISRDFQYGDVRLERTTGIWPNAFNYRIRVNGRVVEEQAIPYHTP